MMLSQIAPYLSLSFYLSIHYPSIRPFVCPSVYLSNSATCSAFVGQYFNDSEGEKLLTMWLLRDAVDTVGENWEATL